MSFKDYTIIQQNIKLDEQNAKLDKQSTDIRELLGYAKDTKETLDTVKDELDETKEDVGIALEHLTNKSFTSTMNPENDSKHHYFAVTQFIKKGAIKVIKFTSGQKSYVETTIGKYVKDLNHKVIIPMFYNANGIDLRQNCKNTLVKFRKQRLIEINNRNKELDKQFNRTLDLEIRKYNRANPNSKRDYYTEKQCTKRVSISDITIKCNVIGFEYTYNVYISFNELIELVTDTNYTTQKNPLVDIE